VAVHLLIDARCVRASPTGVGNAVLRQIQGIDRILPDGWRVTVLRLATEWRHGRFGANWADLTRIHFIDCPVDPADHPRAERWELFELPRLVRAVGATAFYGPAYLIPPWLPAGVGRVVMFHDDLVWSQPGSYPLAFRLMLRARMRLAARTAHRVLFPSAAARDACMARLGLPHHRTGVVPHGLAAPAVTAPWPGERERLVVCVASAEPRKNQELLLEAMRRVPDARLVLVGFNTRDARRLAPWRAAGDRVEIIPSAPAAEVTAWLERARVAALPTRGEGFGFPALEAMAAGLPLVASDLAVLREVAGPAAVYLPPDDVGAWRRVLERALDGDPVFARRAEAGRRRAARFTLERCAARLLREVSRAQRDARR
jgi:glycosyltransferase involved in cell wall biosynthesis